jgi:gas vesicle protein
VTLVSGVRVRLCFGPLRVGDNDDAVFHATDLAVGAGKIVLILTKKLARLVSRASRRIKDKVSSWEEEWPELIEVDSAWKG